MTLQSTVQFRQGNTMPARDCLPEALRHDTMGGTHAVSLIRNAFTIDVEEWFQVSAFDDHIARDQWADQTSRLQVAMDRILALLSERRVKATFFTLGWIAERHPALIRQIAEQGHEIASHGYGHHRVGTFTPKTFRSDVLRTRQLLEDCSGTAVIGYRAPSFSVTRETRWLYPVLAETGHRYSSSVYPIAHDHYGIPDAPRFAHRVPEAPGFVEIPPTSVRLGERNLPAAGGGYFRLLPYRVSRGAIRRVNLQDRQSAVFYFHPWEVDPDQPRMRGVPLKTRFRHYVNLSRMLTRLDHLLVDFRWGRMDEVFAEQIDG